MCSWGVGGLAVIDNLICIVVIFPLSVLHWRGTWQLQDEYFIPDNTLSSAWLSLMIGANVCIVELLLQPLLKEYLSGVSCGTYVVVSRLHLYVHGWAVMCYWRGVWDLLDIYLTTHWVNSVVIYGVCQLTMIVFRTVRTPVGVPVAIQLDTDPELLEPDIVFKTPHSRLIPFVLDCLFTQFVIVSSSICIWRGIWNLADAFIFPHIRNHSDDQSDVVSLLSGLLVTVFFIALQCPTSRLSALLDGRKWAKIAFEDVLFMILMWSNLLLWRGGWNLCMRYFLPERHVGSWVSHWVGTFGLMLLQVFNNVGLHGIVRDGSYMHGEGIYVTYYLRFLLKKDKELPNDAKEPYTTIENGHSGHPVSSDGDSADDELSSVEEQQKLLKVKPVVGCGGDHVAKANLHSLAVFADATREEAVFGGAGNGGHH